MHTADASSIYRPTASLTASAVVIPNGWKLVPDEPTQEMLDAPAAAIAGRALDTFYDDQMAAVYRAMLAAAPQPMVSR